MGSLKRILGCSLLVVVQDRRDAFPMVICPHSWAVVPTSKSWITLHIYPRASNFASLWKLQTIGKWFYVYFYCFKVKLFLFYLKERERVCHCLVHFSKCLQQPRLDRVEVRSLELNPGLPHGWRESKYLSYHCGPPGCRKSALHPGTRTWSSQHLPDTCPDLLINMYIHIHLEKTGQGRQQQGLQSVCIQRHTSLKPYHTLRVSECLRSLESGGDRKHLKQRSFMCKWV